MSTSVKENAQSLHPTTNVASHTEVPNETPDSESTPRVRFNEASKIVALHMAKVSGRPASDFAFLTGAKNFSNTGPSLIIPRLYLGDFSDASEEETIYRHKITHILSITELGNSHMPSRLGDREIQKLQLNLVDRPGVEIRDYFETTTKWISDALKDETAVVLVHCFQGISRSATVVAAYLLSTTNDFNSAKAVINFLRTKRSIVRPNHGFEAQLEKHALACIELRKVPGGVVVLETVVSETEDETVIVQTDTV